MKKLLIVVVVSAGMLLSLSSFADNPEKVSAKVKAAFEKNFVEAEGVNWRKVSDFYFASFSMNNTNIEVAYNEEGEMVAVSKEIDRTQLPLNISMSLDQKYADYNLSDKVLEVVLNGETYYYITASNDHKILKLKCDISGNISIDKKVKK